MNEKQEKYFPYCREVEKEDFQIDPTDDENSFIHFPTTPESDETYLKPFKLNYEVPPIIAKELQYK